MFGFNKNSKAEKAQADETLRQINYALENLTQFYGKDLPIINSDGYDYINNTWKKVGVVYTVTSLIYEKVLQCPVLFYKVKDKKALRKLKAFKATDLESERYKVLKLQALEEINPSDALEALIKNPNPQQNYAQFIGVFVLSYLLTGNTYTYKQISTATKRPYEMWQFPSLHINSGGVYNAVKDYSQFIASANQKNYPAETIYHSRTPNPSFDISGSQLYGVSPLRAFLETLRTVEEATKQASIQMKNGGVLALLSPQRAEDAMSTDQRKGMHAKFMEALKSLDPYKRFMTSSVAMDVKQVGLPSSDLDLLAIKNAGEDEIYNAYNVPLQFRSQEASTRDNQKNADIKLVVNAISPMARIVSDMLTNFIGIHFDDTIIELDAQSLPEMSANMKEQVEWIEKAIDSALITRNEGRYQIGYGEVDADYMNAYMYKGRDLKKLFTGEQEPNNNNNKNE